MKATPELALTTVSEPRTINIRHVAKELNRTVYTLRKWLNDKYPIDFNPARGTWVKLTRCEYVFLKEKSAQSVRRVRATSNLYPSEIKGPAGTLAPELPAANEPTSKPASDQAIVTPIGCDEQRIIVNVPLIIRAAAQATGVTIDQYVQSLIDRRAGYFTEQVLNVPR